jgi:hypothetical protein
MDEPEDDWGAYGCHISAQAYYGRSLIDEARLLLLDEWEGWISGEPPEEEILRELLATFWAMTWSDSFSDRLLKSLAEALAGDVLNRIDARIATTRKRGGSI